jgi:hypothetical protein
MSSRNPTSPGISRTASPKAFSEYCNGRCGSECGKTTEHIVEHATGAAPGCQQRFTGTQESIPGGGAMGLKPTRDCDVEAAAIAPQPLRAP